MDIAAVIVTYNRKTLLVECIQAIRQQTLPVSAIYIVDNASTDCTREYCQEMIGTDVRIVYISLEQNIGGAGGFNYGIRLAYQRGHDYIWVMDDDSVPQQNALEKLCSNEKITELGEWGFLCSNVRWLDGTSCQMNKPTLAKNWSEYVQDKILPVDSCSFVSVLINRKAVQTCGLPIKEFFIWVDDTEYTRRISKLYKNFFVADSLVLHKMNSNQRSNIVTDESDRIDRYFYEYRNRYYMSRISNRGEAKKYRAKMLRTIIKILRSSSRMKGKKIRLILKGFWSGIRFNPPIEMVD